MSEQSKLFVSIFNLPELGESQYKDLVSDLFYNNAEIGIDKEKVTLITDRERGGFKNFCFVEVDDADIASKAIQALDRSVTPEGYELKVNIARPKTEGGPRKSFGNGGGGYSNNNGGYKSRKSW
jgi:RNA recognition motif-containing protein